MSETVVVLSGAGISAESGIQTFRDSDGLWNQYSVMDLATPEAFARNPKLVLDFYNARRQKVAKAEPNAAHLALQKLEAKYEVIIITQNVDNLHERAGSNHVVHLHGEIVKARSTVDPELICEIGYKDIALGNLCPKGGQLRPHIVWFGEQTMNFDFAIGQVSRASKILVVGTSLAVEPAASLLNFASRDSEKVIVALETVREPPGYRFVRNKATVAVPQIVDEWLGENR